MDLRRGKLVNIFVGCTVSITLMTCVNSSCITTEFFLGGLLPTQSSTAANISCERWDALSSLIADMDFGNESLAEAGNSCRNPDGSSFFWCYGIPLEQQVDCYADSSTTYTGQESITKNGHRCQRWSDNKPNSHNYGNDDFPDDTIADAQNFCRDPDSLGTPWCFTVSEEVRWDECNVKICQPLKDKVTKMDCGIGFCAPVSSGCPRGWQRSADGDTCYTISGSKVTWQESVANCENFGAKQLGFDDSDEYFFVKNVLLINEKDTFWLGLSDQDTEGTFIWRTTGKELSFSDWFPGEPDNFFNSEDCVSISFGKDGYTWRDDNCDRNNNYICETVATEIEVTEPISMSTTTKTTTSTALAETTLATSGYDKCGINMVVTITSVVSPFLFVVF